MAGSSGFHFVRAAYAHGMLSRRRLAADTWVALRFRLLGSTDAATAKLRARMGAYVEGRRVRDMQRLAPTVLAPTIALPGARQYALAPELARLLPLFTANRMGVMLNVGTLIQPTTKAQYTNGSVPLPPKLFSHNDQQSVWQSQAPEGAASGWGGRMGDLFVAGNGSATFTCVNVSGNAVYLSGNTAVQYQVSTTGPVAFAGIAAPLFGSAACSTALQSLVTAPRTHLFEAEYTRVAKRSIDAGAVLTSALAGAPAITTPFPAGNALADQLKFVARMISTAATTSTKRQVFFVSIGGFDTHDGLAAIHPGLLTTVSSALAAFYQATVELGVASQVTTFTASDFRAPASTSTRRPSGSGSASATPTFSPCCPTWRTTTRASATSASSEPALSGSRRRRRRARASPSGWRAPSRAAANTSGSPAGRCESARSRRRCADRRRAASP